MRGEYSKIFAFEPDPISASICRKNLLARDIRDFYLVEAGLSDREGKAAFRTGLYNCSHVVEDGSAEENVVTLSLTTVDGTVVTCLPLWTMYIIWYRSTDFGSGITV